MENRCISIPERNYPWISFPDMIFRFYEALERSKDRFQGRCRTRSSAVSTTISFRCHTKTNKAG
jgi:hypothetical protein